MLWGWNCNIQPYSCLIMGSSYVEFNAPDVEGISFIKQKHSRLLNICDPIDGSSILQTTVSFVSSLDTVGYCFLV